MTSHFDFHDTISVMIPGVCAMGLFGAFTCGSPAEGVQQLSGVSVGASLLLLACSYIIGEFLQGIGEYTVKRYYRHCSGGEPLYWILPREDKHLQGDSLLPASACRTVVAHLAKTMCIHPMTKEILGQCFPHIKTRVYAHEIYRTECVKMLTKANFYSAMAVLFFLVPIFLLLSSPCRGEGCCIVSYCLTHDIWGLTSSTHLSCVERILSFTISWGISFGCARRYRFFNIIYNRSLISAYLELI